MMRSGLKKVIVWILKMVVKSAMDIFVGDSIGAALTIIWPAARDFVSVFF